MQHFSFRSSAIRKSRLLGSSEPFLRFLKRNPFKGCVWREQSFRHSNRCSSWMLIVDFRCGRLVWMLNVNAHLQFEMRTVWTFIERLRPNIVEQFDSDDWPLNARSLCLSSGGSDRRRSTSTCWFEDRHYGRLMGSHWVVLIKSFVREPLQVCTFNRSVSSTKLQIGKNLPDRTAGCSPKVSPYRSP